MIFHSASGCHIHSPTMRRHPKSRGVAGMKRGDDVTAIRITSYNVCYTKLLRAMLPTTMPYRDKWRLRGRLGSFLATEAEKREALARKPPRVEGFEHGAVGLGLVAAVAIAATRGQRGELRPDHHAHAGALPVRRVPGRELGRHLAPPVITSYSIHYTKLYDPRGARRG